MNRTQMMEAVDEAFEEYADGNSKMSLENLRSRVRIVVTEYCDEISHDLENIGKSLSDIMGN